MNNTPSASGAQDEDDALVVQAKTDREAFGLLFDRYYPRVIRYCLRRLIDRSVAEDVTSEVFLRVAEHFPSFSGATETDFRCWLFRIAANAANAQLRQDCRRAELRQAARTKRAEAFVAPSESNSNASDRLDWPVVRQAIEELDDREQTILSLRFFADLSHDEIAKIVGVSAGGVRTALSRTLARLRDRFRSSVRRE